MMRACHGQATRQILLHHRPFAGPLQRALFKSRRARGAAPNQTALPHCLRDCFGVREAWAANLTLTPREMPLVRHPLLRSTQSFSEDCMYACTCFFREAFG